VFNFNLSKGILGINARNLLYIRPYNKKKAIKLADSKLKTKHFLSARGIPVPKLYGVIRSRDELGRFDFNALPSTFVLKPNFGYGGEGIIPVVGRDGSNFITSSGRKISPDVFVEHIGDILDGRYSLTGSSDIAFFEQLIICDDKVGRYAYKGLPDIRVVVHNLIPVMAMLRLPTVNSDGKANLHLGAIAAGIDIAKGVTTHVVDNKKIVEGPKGLRGLEIPYWDEILLICSKVQIITNLGYLAVDIALDKTNGPVLLEVNARAGLGVQIANLAPLRKRLERIRGVKVTTPEKGVRIAQDMFGNKIEKDIQNVSGKAVVGQKETVDVIGKKGPMKVIASINPVVEGTVIDKSLAQSLALISDDASDEGDKIKLKFTMADIRLQTIAGLEDLSSKDFKLVIGKRDLGNFLVDPSRTYKSKGKIPEFKGVSPDNMGESSKINYADIDNILSDIDRQIKILHHLRPVNLEQERITFLKEKKYNPQFVYPDLKFDPFRLREKLKRIECDGLALGQIFNSKRREILKKLSLVEHIGTDAFSDKSYDLFGLPDDELLDAARAFLDAKPHSFPYEDLSIDHEEAAKRFDKIFNDYGLDEWSTKIKESMVSDCMAGKKGTLFVRKGSMFSEVRLKMLIAHEIETHILTAENGENQPYKVFNRGLAGYLETQEGLAVRNQMLVTDHDVEKNYWSALSVLAVSVAYEKSFYEVFEMVRDLGFSETRAFQVALKVKRGLEDTKLRGVFTKDFIYFKGFNAIKKFESEGGNIKDLYIGKFNLRDLDLVKSVPNLAPPKLLPKWL